MTNPYKLLIEHLACDNSYSIINQTIFEAGFEDLGYIFNIYDKFKFSKYYGIEQINENEMFVSFILEDGSIDNVSGGGSAYDIYSKYLKETKNSNGFKEEHFKELFDLRFQTNIEEYIYSNNLFNPQFNIGIFNKLFHRLDHRNKPIEILKWFKKNSIPNALALFSVNIKDKSTFYNQTHNLDIPKYVYSKNEIDELINSVNGNIINYEFQDTHFVSYLIGINN